MSKSPNIQFRFSLIWPIVVTVFLPILIDLASYRFGNGKDVEREYSRSIRSSCEFNANIDSNGKIPNENMQRELGDGCVIPLEITNGATTSHDLLTISSGSRNKGVNCTIQEHIGMISYPIRKRVSPGESLTIKINICETFPQENREFSIACEKESYSCPGALDNFKVDLAYSGQQGLSGENILVITAQSDPSSNPSISEYREILDKHGTTNMKPVHAKGQLRNETKSATIYYNKAATQNLLYMQQVLQEWDPEREMFQYELTYENLDRDLIQKYMKNGVYVLGDCRNERDCPNSFASLDQNFNDYTPDLLSSENIKEISFVVFINR